VLDLQLVEGEFDDGAQARWLGATSRKRMQLHSHEMNVLHVCVRSHSQGCIYYRLNNSFKNAKESAADQAAP
jgi:hypothetical protein